MAKSSAVLVGALLLTAFVAPVFAEPLTITGQLVDLACYAVKQETGNAHKGKGLICAQACAREGFPVGILTSDGKVYQITGELASHTNAKLIPRMAKTVTITGDVSEKGGITFITASDLK